MVSNGEKFYVRYTDKKFNIELHKNGIFVGEIKAIKEVNAYWWFKTWLTKEEFELNFPTESFWVVALVYVDKQFRGKGFGTKLLDKFQQYRLQRYPDENMVLQTSPMENSIQTEALAMLYERYGFKKFIKIKSKYIMIL